MRQLSLEAPKVRAWTDLYVRLGGPGFRAGPTPSTSRGEGLALRRHVTEILRGAQLLAVGVGQLVGTLDERVDADRAVGGLVAGDELGSATGRRREADAEDRADVRVGRRGDHTLLEALGRLDGLAHEHALLEVDQRVL